MDKEHQDGRIQGQGCPASFTTIRIHDPCPCPGTLPRYTEANKRYSGRRPGHRLGPRALGEVRIVKHWEVRTNCEYVLEVDAESEEEAIAKANKIDVTEWDQAWAPMEIEEVARPSLDT